MDTFALEGKICIASQAETYDGRSTTKCLFPFIVVTMLPKFRFLGVNVYDCNVRIDNHAHALCNLRSKLLPSRRHGRHGGCFLVFVSNDLSTQASLCLF